MKGSSKLITFFIVFILLFSQISLLSLAAPKDKGKGTPMGVNYSRGIQYSWNSWVDNQGLPNPQASFAIGRNRIPNIIVDRQGNGPNNYNAVGGLGRFYTDNNFRDLCNPNVLDACSAREKRSLVGITDQNYVIFVVNNNYIANSLATDEFDNLLEGITEEYDIGVIENALLFDGGGSPGLVMNKDIVVKNHNNIGSVFLIYSL